MLNKIILLIICFVASTAVAIENGKLSAVQDAYIQKDTPELSFGKKPHVLASMTEQGNSQKGYLLFDASDLPRVTSVDALEAHFAGRYGRSSLVYLLPSSEGGNDWSERTLTWETAPLNLKTSLHGLAAEAVYLGQFEVAKEPKERIEVQWENQEGKNQLVRALNEGDRTVTIAFTRNSDSRYFSIYSREATIGGVLPATLKVSFGD